VKIVGSNFKMIITLFDTYKDFLPFLGLATIFLAGLVFFIKRKSTDATAVTEAVQPKELVASSEKVVSKTLDFKERLKLGLAKSRLGVWGKVKALVTGAAIDQETKEQLEAILFQADIPTTMVEKILHDVGRRGENTSLIDDIKLIMREVFEKSSLSQGQNEQHLEKSWNTELRETTKMSTQVIMIVGVNGVGKTTTVGKMAAALSRSGMKVVVAAADTFRAAAKEQLMVWCERAGADLVTGHENNNDPAAVCYQALTKAIELKADYCLLDTAGRLHNNDQLMEELKKIKRVISKLMPGAPHEVLLVLDAMTGQNALRQAAQFQQALGGLTGVVLTKCDGSAKAGCALAIVEQLKVPIRFIGVGETLEDLNIFKAEEFVDALFED
jgi:fused signal recognition particle receptor